MSSEKDRLLSHQDSISAETSSQGVRDNYGSTSGQESAKVRAARLSSVTHGSSILSFHDINYEVDVKKSACGKKVKKQILKDVNGIFRPGMNAILGPTGSGKSSLLDVLAGRKDPKGLTGTILLDGAPLPDNFKCLVGYVVQDDVVMGTLTIRENFEFSATLRLPSNIKKHERKERIDQVIYELGLTEVADSKVGTEFIRGVSGGERKRCNIGMELIISPPVLFLDEPTTGLDASTANAVMLLLKRLADRGRNIIFSIHQPRYSIYRLFDSLMLLSHGDVAYHGKACEALDYFASVGYICEEHNNPPDFFLDVINGDSTAVSSTQAAEANGTVGDSNQTEKKTSASGAAEDAIVTVEESSRSLRDLFRNSKWHTSVQNELKPIIDAHKQFSNNVRIKRTKIEYNTSFFTQLLTVSKRCIKNISRNPHVSIMQFVVIAIFALIVGGVYFQINKSKESGIQNRAGAFFFIIMNQVFGNMSAVELFIKERAIFIHENVGGFYRVSAYFLAKVFCDVIPLRLIPAAIFSCISYFMLGLRSGVDHFFFFALNLFLTAMSASALSFAISSTVRIFALANLCLALCYVFMMLFSGLLINVGDLGDWISWIKYLSVFRYSLNALEINELKGQKFCSSANSTDCIYGEVYLELQKISYESPWDLWQNEAALGIMIAGYLILAYIQLRRIKKLK
ncbi:broad substrate specificity ATP-binding cassette transporter ABCG2-like isoform X2 [Biomphalaria glabrata]|uniref:Broad substrate specificity ATP-binding cassette transporter ABCG2-like isoform X2 n=1 Tax=Biomphalaria glabrata TaxID=6526 RepID=A0A9W2ZRS7_BIOGL|nr:broad substrate specificity ATP-binding cassette transporter ABCG2-like isoform X2 [Biomphalaria glabrata]